MHATKHVKAALPADLLKVACHATGKGVTETLIEGLELIKRSTAGRRLMELKGKLNLAIDLDTSRERARH